MVEVRSVGCPIKLAALACDSNGATASDYDEYTWFDMITELSLKSLLLPVVTGETGGPDVAVS